MMCSFSNNVNSNPVPKHTSHDSPLSKEQLCSPQNNEEIATTSTIGMNTIVEQPSSARSFLRQSFLDQPSSFDRYDGLYSQPNDCANTLQSDSHNYNSISDTFNNSLYTILTDPTTSINTQSNIQPETRSSFSKLSDAFLESTNIFDSHASLQQTSLSPSPACDDDTLISSLAESLPLEILSTLANDHGPSLQASSLLSYVLSNGLSLAGTIERSVNAAASSATNAAAMFRHSLSFTPQDTRPADVRSLDLEQLAARNRKAEDSFERQQHLQALDFSLSQMRKKDHDCGTHHSSSDNRNSFSLHDDGQPWGLFPNEAYSAIGRQTYCSTRDDGTSTPPPPPPPPPPSGSEPCTGSPSYRRPHQALNHTTLEGSTAPPPPPPPPTEDTLRSQAEAAFNTIMGLLMKTRTGAGLSNATMLFWQLFQSALNEMGNLRTTVAAMRLTISQLIDRLETTTNGLNEARKELYDLTESDQKMHHWVESVSYSSNSHFNSSTSPSHPSNNDSSGSLHTTIQSINDIQPRPPQFIPPPPPPPGDLKKTNVYQNGIPPPPPPPPPISNIQLLNNTTPSPRHPGRPPLPHHYTHRNTTAPVPPPPQHNAQKNTYLSHHTRTTKQYGSQSPRQVSENPLPSPSLSTNQILHPLNNSFTVNSSSSSIDNQDPSRQSYLSTSFIENNEELISGSFSARTHRSIDGSHLQPETCYSESTRASSGSTSPLTPRIIERDNSMERDSMKHIHCSSSMPSSLQTSFAPLFSIDQHDSSMFQSSPNSNSDPHFYARRH